MRRERDDLHYREPTAVEKAFLQVVTHGYPELQEQVEDFEIADYDVRGWCYLRIRNGRTSSIRSMVEGPTLDPSDAPIETLLWTNERGQLTAVEIVMYAEAIDDPYERFVTAAGRQTLIYRSEK